LKIYSGRKNKEPFVSILTPVYNGEKYLEECIESVLAQTYQNWEYVIVNNCSTDRSLEIAEKYAKQDERIQIHNNSEHFPVMQNLNHAFRQISSDSKYCKVIHADDWLFPECVSRMVELSEEYPDIGLVGSYRLVGKNVGPNGLPFPSHHISGEEIARRYLLHEENYFGAPSTILLRSDLIRKREKFYNESYIQSDISACLDILRESDFGFVHQVLSYTRRHEDTVTERVAKEDSTYIYGYLKIHLDYGPVFLNEKEMDQSLSRRIDIYYIQVAREIIFEKSLRPYWRREEELESENIPFKRRKLLKHIFIEMFKLPLKKVLRYAGISE